MKTLTKVIPLVFLSIIMLISVGLPHAQAQSGVDTSKFDPGFYEVITEKMEDSPLTNNAKSQVQYHSVIIVTHHKENVVNALTRDFDAQNIFNPKHLTNVVTADVPVSLVPRLSANPDIIKLGDGELEMEQFYAPFNPTNPHTLSILQAKQISNWSSNVTETGKGVTVGFYDVFNNPSHHDLPDSTVIERVYCSSICSTPIPDYRMVGTHFNHGASILAGSGESNPVMRGIAHDSKIILSVGSWVSALDYLLGKDVDIILSIAGTKVSSCNTGGGLPHTHALVTDSIVNNGVSVIMSNGNQGTSKINAKSCSYNGMSVGNIKSDGSIDSTSSRGGIPDFINPSISAIGTNIAGADVGTDYGVASGTSFSTPVVTGAAALLLDRNPDLSPNELRTALRLGANFNHTGEVTGSTVTADDYEGTAHPTLVSYMNDFGFGTLNIQNSLDLVTDSAFPYMISDNVSGTSDKKYRIYAHSGDDVKILMSWNVATVGQSDETAYANSTLPLGALENYTLEVIAPDGSKIISNSTKQNTEFAYFTAGADGYHTIKITTESAESSQIGYTIASNHPLDDHTFSYGLPAGSLAPECGTNEICKLGSVIPAISDGFDSLDEWEFVNTDDSSDSAAFNSYAASIDTQAGNPAPSALIRGDGFKSTSFLARTIPLNISDDDELFLGVDYRAVSDTADSSVTNAILNITDWQGNVLHSEHLNRGGTTDSGWQSFGKDITDIVKNQDAITVRLTLVDQWSENQNQKAYFDNFYLGTIGPQSTQNPHSDGAPVLTVPDDKTFEITAPEISLTEAQLGTATATDDFDPSPTVTSSVPDAFGQGRTTILYTATDSAGNISTKTQTITITVRDTTPPVIYSPTNQTVFATAPSGVAGNYRVPYATDSVGNKVPVYCDPAPGSIFEVGETMVTCSATDSANNTSAATFYIIVELRYPIMQDSFESMDGWIPEKNTFYINGFNNYTASIDTQEGNPSPSAVISGDGYGAFYFITKTIHLDNLNYDDLFLSIDYRAVSDTADNGAARVALDITDLQGNYLYFEWLLSDGTTDSGWRSFDKDIMGMVDGSDVIAVKLLLEDRLSGNHHQKVYFDNFYLATTSDLIPPTVSGNPVFDPETGILDITFDESVDISTVNATKFHIRESGFDSGGITMSHGELDTTSDSTTVQFTLTESNRQVVMALDTPTLSVDDGAISDVTGNGIVLIRNQELDIVDVTSPVLTVPDDVTFEAKAEYTTLTEEQLGTATATDDWDPDPEITSNAPAAFQLGNTTVTYTATDRAGNTSTGTQTVTIQDTTAPVIDARDITLYAPGQAYYAPVAADIFPVTIQCSPESGTTFGLGATEVTCTATDENSNTSTESFDVRVLQFATIRDSFESLDSWRLTNTNGTFENPNFPSHVSFNNYTAGIDAQNGRPAPSALITGDGLASASSFTRTVSLYNFEEDALFLGLDYRIESTITDSVITNAKLNITDAEGNILHSQWLHPWGSRDTGWQSFGKDIIDMAQGHEYLNVHVYFADDRTSDYHLRIHIDNFYFGTEAPPGAPPVISGLPALNEMTGVLLIEFNEPLDMSTADAKSFYIRERGSTEGVILSDATVEAVGDRTIRFTLNESDRQAVVALNTPTLYTKGYPVYDMHGVGMWYVQDLPLDVIPDPLLDIMHDVLPPTVLGTPTLNENSGVLSITFDEFVDISSINASGFHIRENGTSSGGITLSNDELDTTVNGIALQFTTDESDRQAIIALANPTLHIDEGSVYDSAGNGIEQVSDQRIDITQEAPRNAPQNSPKSMSGTTLKTLSPKADTIPPTITLDGDNPQTVPLNAQYTEYSGTVHDEGNDSYAGTISADISALDTAQPGVYTVTYSAPADQAGNTPEPQHRTVIVYDPQTNLVQNGSFEEPTLDRSWGVYGQVSHWTIQWNVQNPHVTQANTCPADAVLEIQTSQISGPADGTQFAELDSHCSVRPSTSVAIFQDIPTEPGKEYTLSFASKKRINTQDDSNGLQVSADGTTLETVNDMSTAWQVHTIQFTARDESTTISFADTGRPDGLGTLLDSIAVTAANETANLVQNGSFEDSAVTANGSVWQLYESAQVPGWSVSWNSDNPHSSNPCPADAVLELQKGVSGGADTGANHAELDTHCTERFSSSTAISQTIPTIPGVQYELSWYSHNRPNTEASSNGLDVTLDGQIVSDEQLTRDWSRGTYSFVADSENTTIGFADTGVPDSLGTLLDGVFVSIVSNN